MGSLIRRVAKLARSPQGRRAIREAASFAQRPENRRKLERLGRSLLKSRSRRYHH